MTGRRFGSEGALRNRSAAVVVLGVSVQIVPAASHQSRTYRARRRGSLAMDEAKLRARYDAAVRGKRRGPAWRQPENLFAATGDPLAEQDPVLAAHLYGLAEAPRPAVALRRIRSEAFGDTLSSLTDMAIWYQDNRRWSVLRSAGEAAALAAERGSWIGVKAPVSFDRAVELIRKSVGRARALGRLRYLPPGWTGGHIFVVPVPGLLVPMPAPLPPRSRLPAEGAWVKGRFVLATATQRWRCPAEINAARKSPNYRSGRDGILKLMGEARLSAPEHPMTILDLTTAYFHMVLNVDPATLTILVQAVSPMLWRR